MGLKIIADLNAFMNQILNPFDLKNIEEKYPYTYKRAINS